MVGDRDRAQADRLGVVEEVRHRHGAVVGMLGVHVQVGEDERPVGQRVGGDLGTCAPLAENGAVESLQVVRKASEALALSAAMRLGRAPLTPGRVLSQARQGSADKLRLVPRARGIDEGHAGGLGLDGEAHAPPLGGDEAGCALQLERPRRAVESAADE